MFNFLRPKDLELEQLKKRYRHYLKFRNLDETKPCYAFNNNCLKSSGSSHYHILNAELKLSLADLLCFEGNLDKLKDELKNHPPKDTVSLFFRATEGGRQNILEHLIALTKQKESGGWNMIPAYYLDKNKDKEGKSLLHYAIAHNRTPVVKYLAKESDHMVSNQGFRHKHPALMAIEKGNVEMLDAIINPFDRQIPVKRLMSRLGEFGQGRNLLHEAACLGNQAAVEYLIQKYPQLISEGDRFNRLPLFVAAENGHIEIV